MVASGLQVSTKQAAQLACRASLYELGKSIVYISPSVVDVDLRPALRSGCPPWLTGIRTRIKGAKQYPGVMGVAE